MKFLEIISSMKQLKETVELGVSLPSVLFIFIWLNHIRVSHSIKFQRVTLSVQGAQYVFVEMKRGILIVNKAIEDLKEPRPQLFVFHHCPYAQRFDNVVEEIFHIHEIFFQSSLLDIALKRQRIIFELWFSLKKIKNGLVIMY